jgi:hypothetical protein
VLELVVFDDVGVATVDSELLLFTAETEAGAGGGAEEDKDEDDEDEDDDDVAK